MFFYIVDQKLSRPPVKRQTTHTGVATPRLKTADLEGGEKFLFSGLLLKPCFEA